MTWYLVPIVEVPAEEGRVPCSGAGLAPGVDGVAVPLPPASRMYVPLTGPVSPTGLIGSEAALEPIPNGWLSKTLAEAQAEFEALYGRTPTADEVF